MRIVALTQWLLRIERLFAITICVATDSTTQFQRLQRRNPELSAEECKQRINSQMKLEKKRKLADIVIENSGTIDELRVKVEDVRGDIMGRLNGIGISLLQMLLLFGGSTSMAASSRFFTYQQQH